MSGSGMAGRGIRGAANAVPMRNGPPLMTRPPSGTTAPPAVASTTTLTAAGVVGYGRDADNACFQVVGRVGPAGLAVGATGTIVVALVGSLLAPSAYWAGASWATVVLSGSNSALSLAWTAVEAQRANAVVVIQVEWRAST